MMRKDKGVREESCVATRASADSMTVNIDAFGMNVVFLGVLGLLRYVSSALYVEACARRRHPWYFCWRSHLAPQKRQLCSDLCSFKMLDDINFILEMQRIRFNKQGLVFSSHFFFI